MARPTNRQELIDAAQRGYVAVVEFINGLSENQRLAEFDFDDRDRNVRDVVAHLLAWQTMMERWYADGMAGTKPAIPSEGHTWRTTPALNQEIWQAAQGQPLDRVMAELADSHTRMMTLIETHTNDELFTRKLFPWTGTTSLGAFLVSATSSHYDWAMKKLRKAKRGWV